MLWFSNFFRLFFVKNCFCYRLEQTQTAKLIRYKVKFCPWFSFVDVVCVNKSAMSEIYISENLLVAAEKCNTQRRGDKGVRIGNETFLKSNHFVPVRGEGHRFNIYLFRKHKHTRSKTAVIRWVSSSSLLLESPTTWLKENGKALGTRIPGLTRLDYDHLTAAM